MLPALQRLRRLIEEGTDEAVVLRAIDSILDRVGFGRHQKVEERTTISLDQKTIEQLTRAMKEADAVELDPKTDWSYATQQLPKRNSNGKQ